MQLAQLESLNETQEANATEAFALESSSATSAISTLKLAGLNFIQIFQLVVTYGPALWAMVTKGGEWLRQVIEAIKNGDPLPPLSL